MVMTSSGLYDAPITRSAETQPPVVQIDTGSVDIQLNPIVRPISSEEKIRSDGGSTKYYELPEGAKELNDLIEFKNMPFALANIFKACYRFGEKDGAEKLYDINKMIYFAERLKLMLERGQL